MATKTIRTEAEIDDAMCLRLIRREERDIVRGERMDRREANAATMIGKLMREGREVLYVYPVGGKYREGTRGQLVDFLIRNRYA